MSVDEKKPPEGGGVIAQIRIDLLPGGRACMAAQAGGRLDSIYAARPDRDIPGELSKLIGELRAT